MRDREVNIRPEIVDAVVSLCEEAGRPVDDFVEMALLIAIELHNKRILREAYLDLFVGKG